MTEQQSLRAILRQAAYLFPEDSAQRALEATRYSGGTTVPIIDGASHLVGCIGAADLRGLLDKPEDLTAPVARWMRQPVTIPAQASVADVRAALRSSGESTVFVVDHQRRYLGSVGIADVLVPAAGSTRPPSVGGLATPWGVYLQCGTASAGSSAVSLVGSGICMGVALIASHRLIGFLSWAAHHWWSSIAWSLWNAPQPATLTGNTVLWYLLQAAAIPVFLVVLRAMPLTGYHAAEHQTIHALERGEPLELEVVRRMPRVHPRCGTNIMAGVAIFAVVSQAAMLLPMLRLDAVDSAAIGALCALLTWRRVGEFLQQYITTKPASDRQLLAGIASAEELGRRYLTGAPIRPTIWARIWRMAIPQTLVGVMIGSSGALFALDSILSTLR